MQFPRNHYILPIFTIFSENGRFYAESKEVWNTQSFLGHTQYANSIKMKKKSIGNYVENNRLKILYSVVKTLLWVGALSRW